MASGSFLRGRGAAVAAAAGVFAEGFAAAFVRERFDFF
jgi:hypothetical protein